MKGCLGWFILMPIVGTFWLTVTIASACAKKDGAWRLLGMFSSLVIGGMAMGLTHILFSGENGSKVLWWIGMTVGGLITLTGIWTAVMQAPEK
jgi:hypothetical protein